MNPLTSEQRNTLAFIVGLLCLGRLVVFPPDHLTPEVFALIAGCLFGATAMVVKKPDQ